MKKTVLSGPCIAVIGTRAAGKKVLAQAELVGGLIARSGCTLVTGGLGGVMEAASRGARMAGGLTIGILPSDRRADANPYIDIAVPTGFGIGRNIIIARTAMAAIAIRGGYGTLSEIAFFLQLEKPVAGIGTWDIKGVVDANDPEDALRMVLERLSL